LPARAHCQFTYFRLLSVSGLTIIGAAALPSADQQAHFNQLVEIQRPGCFSSVSEVAVHFIVDEAVEVNVIRYGLVIRLQQKKIKGFDAQPG